MKLSHWVVLAGVALGGPPFSAPAAAQPRPGVTPLEEAIRGITLPSSARRDPLADAFFTPEVVMRHQQTIGLTGEQRSAIVAAISAAQPRFIEAQWQLEPETAALADMLSGARVDEPAVLQQMDRVLELERQIKRIQVEMLVRIKNQLTSEQQEQLVRLGGVRGTRSFFDYDTRFLPIGGSATFQESWSIRGGGG